MPRTPVELGFEELPIGDSIYRWSLFRTKVVGVDCSYADLSYCSIMRSQIEDCSFAHCSGSMLRLTHNDFVRCDFTNAVLSGADVRGSVFECCKFVGADLKGVDLRNSEFRRCDFRQCHLAAAFVTVAQYLFLQLDPPERNLVVCKLTKGKLPPEG
jgi:uncharacterized protein YjbI with pentapeptide repeats